MRSATDYGRLVVSVILVAAVLWANGCSKEQKPSSCTGVTCSGHGQCVDVSGKPVCRCELPYKATTDGRGCELVCGRVICSGHGTCTETGGESVCRCEDGYRATADGYSCVEEGDPCSGVDCSGTNKGTCRVDGNTEPHCQCNSGYINDDRNPLFCVEPCTFIDLCQGKLCTRDVDCCEHGTCKVDGNGKGYCDCENAYRPDPYDPSCCIRTGECLATGQACGNSTDCCTNFCLIYSGDEEGYCSKRNCISHGDCTNVSRDGKAMCCEDIGGEYYVCFKLGTGCNCGDSTGGCGTSCTCQIDTACSTDTMCLMSSLGGPDDPNATCSKPCVQDIDCNECMSPDKPDMLFSCREISGGQKYCQPDRGDECKSRFECDGDAVCIPTADETGLNMIGFCAHFGEAPTGSKCDGDADFSILPPEERCIGLYCFNDYCSEMCEFDTDCPNHMDCQSIGFCVDASCSVSTNPVGLCWKNPVGNSGPGEACPFGDTNKTADDCQDGMACLGFPIDDSTDCYIDEDCFDDIEEQFNPDCVNGHCGASFCAPKCGPSNECPPGFMAQQVGEDCYCAPSQKPGDSGPGDPCPFGDVHVDSDTCQLGLTCLGIPPSSSTPECGTDEDCYIDANFSEARNAECVNGNCGASFCAPLCDTNDQCETGFEPVDVSGTCYCAPV